MAANVGRSAFRTSLTSALRPRRSPTLNFRQRIHDSRSLPFPPQRRLVNIITLGVPLVGGSILYFYPSEQSPVPTILASPTVIPCTDGDSCPRSFQTHQMSSPNEEDKTVIRRVLDVLRDRIWEPLCTGARFLHLFVLFAPVILTSPMLFVGQPHNKRGDRWGALWWYKFLVAQMQRAGPTFIKVGVCYTTMRWRASSSIDRILVDLSHSLHNGRDHGKTFSLRNCVNVSEHYTPTGVHTPLLIPSASSSMHSVAHSTKYSRNSITSQSGRVQ